MDFEGMGRVAANTTLAASAAGLVAMLFVYPRAHKWDTGISVNGFLAGLVAMLIFSGVGYSLITKNEEAPA